MASRAKVSDLDGNALTSEHVLGQSFIVQNGETGLVDEVDEIVGGTEFESETGAEVDEAAESDNHQAVQSPFAPLLTESEGEGSETGETGDSEASDTESMFESVEGFEERQETESDAQDEALIEASFADADSPEFFGALLPILAPIVKTVLPTIAGAVVQQGAKTLSPRLQALLKRLSQLGINPALLRQRETGDESGDGVEFDEASLNVIEQQIEAIEVVIGRDDRVQVKNTKIIPWRRICHLKITTATGKSYLGTGFFIGPRTIITAGHCVYIHSEGGWARQIVVTPGRNGADKPFNSYTATSFRSVKGWVNGKLRNYDYGAIILPRNASVPESLGAFGFANYPNAVLLNKRLNLAGYPGDKPAGTMWFDGRKAKSVTKRTLVYEADTVGGQSGAPVWIWDATGKRRVVGIHTNGAQSGNSATRITKPVFENMKRWRAEGAGTRASAPNPQAPMKHSKVSVEG
jgi:V8-like Glu-specific endopeptidase